MIGQNEATSGGSTSGITRNGLYGFSTNFDDSAASLLAETRTQRLHPAQSMAQGLLLRKDTPPAGVFLLMLVGWAEELERRSQRRHRQTIMLVATQEIGTVTAQNIIRAKPLKKNYAHH